MFLPKLVIYTKHLKVSYRIHNATLISERAVRMIFHSKGNLAMDTSVGNLSTPISMVDDAVFHRYKHWYCTVSMLIKRGEYFPTDTQCMLTLSVVNKPYHEYKCERW